MKKIKTAEEYLERFETEIEDVGESGMFNWLVNAQYEEMTNIIKQVQLDMLEYAVNKCAENVTSTTIQTLTGYETHIDEQSILKTIDEIKEELKI